jgi:hypothetical protein
MPSITCMMSSLVSFSYINIDIGDRKIKIGIKIVIDTEHKAGDLKKMFLAIHERLINQK